MFGHLSRDCKAEKKERRMECKVKSTGVNTTASNTPVNDDSSYKWTYVSLKGKRVASSPPSARVNSTDSSCSAAVPPGCKC